MRLCNVLVSDCCCRASAPLTQQKHTERRSVCVVTCRHSPLLLSLPSSNTLRPSSPANRLSLSQANNCNPLICSQQQRMQSRSKENQIQTALMQCYILPLLLILGVRDGLGTPLTSSPGPTEAPSAPPDPCEGRPCLNGGVCSRVGEMEESPSTQMQTDFWAYTCICGQGFTGQNCEVSRVGVNKRSTIIVCLSKVCRSSCAVGEMWRRVLRCCGNR